jgi:uncharacterized small protein (DUF1192 family)
MIMATVLPVAAVNPTTDSTQLAALRQQLLASQAQQTAARVGIGANAPTNNTVTSNAAAIAVLQAEITRLSAAAAAPTPPAATAAAGAAAAPAGGTAAAAATAANTATAGAAAVNGAGAAAAVATGTPPTAVPHSLTLGTTVNVIV